jgi:molybdopterin-guanine dinucleotide biosynthesis protein A
MGVADKTRISVGGVSLLDRTLRALTGAQHIVVVGEQRATTVDVGWTREQPPGGGPAAALAAGLAHVTADLVVVLAADIPLITSEDVEDLAAAIAGDGAVYLDGMGREQWLCSAWRSASLRGVPLVAGAAIGRALGGLEFARKPAPMSVLDCDTPEDLARVEEQLT